MDYGNAQISMASQHPQIAQPEQPDSRAVELTGSKQQYSVNQQQQIQQQQQQQRRQQIQLQQQQQFQQQQQQLQQQQQQQLQQQHLQQQQQLQQQMHQQIQQQIQQQQIQQQQLQQHQAQQQQIQQQQQQTVDHQNQQQSIHQPQAPKQPLQLQRLHGQHPHQPTQQSQLTRTSSHQAVQSLQQSAVTSAGTQHQPQVGQPSVPQPASVAPNMAGFPFFQQNALLTQSQSIPALMITSVAQTGQEQRADQQAPSQFPFSTDPNAFLRQLQVAQLQQQFNSFQQARPMPQEVVAGNTTAAPATAALQMQFQPQVAKAPTAQVVASQPVAPQASSSALKKNRPPAAKKTTAGKKKPPVLNLTSVVSKLPVVSASDTDGELSTRLDSSCLKGLTRAPSFDESLSKGNDIDTSNMTPAEKARTNRDRNREHARNTRLRKKAYLEKLKSTVDDLCRERDTLVSERAGAANILVDMHNTRTEVLMSFFALRSANEKRRELWASILDESCFACIQPVTPYRSFPASEVQVSKCQRTILGIDGMMSDTASLHVLLNSLVDRSRFPNATIVFRYTLVTEEAVVAGNQVMARWVMSTLNATQCGARMEVAKQGMLCCKFNSAHKIIGLELMFDVMALMLQLKQAAGAETFSVIPNTVQTCQRSFDKPMVMSLAEEPYTIVQVNKLWEDITGYKAEEVVGKASCRLLEGEETDVGAVEVLMNEIRFKRPASAMLVNYKKSGEIFRNFFLVYPLSTDSRITHYLYLSSHVDNLVSGVLAKKSARSNHQSQSQNIEANNHVALQNPRHIPVAPPSQQAFFNSIQNLQASGTGPSVPRSAPQSFLGAGPALSSSLVGQAGQGTGLSSGLAVTAGVAMAQVSFSGTKRSHEDLAVMSAAKQPKNGLDAT
jgi:PAS domain S-box-containing protein